MRVRLTLCSGSRRASGCRALQTLVEAGRDAVGVRELRVHRSATVPTSCERDAGQQLATRESEQLIAVSAEAVMESLSWIVFGFIVGVFAKVLMPGRDPGGLIVTVLLGIAGAFVGAWVGQALGIYRPGQPAGWLMSIGGAIILLALY